MSKPNKIVKASACFLIVFIFWSVAFKVIPKEFYDLGGDSTHYIILAESLSSGKGLRLVNYPGEPLSFYFPPAFPFLLSFIIYFWGRNFYLMHLLVAILGFLSLFFLYPVFKRYADKKIAFVTLCIFATNWVFITYSTEYILSDIAYLFFSSLCIFMAVRYQEKTHFLNKEGFWLVSALILSYFTRHIGLLLFLGITISLLLSDKENKFKKLFFIAVGFLLFFGTWHIIEFLNPPQYPSHLKLFFLIDPYAPYKGSLFAKPLYFIIHFIEGVNRFVFSLADISFFHFFKKSIFLNELLSSFVMGMALLGLWSNFRMHKDGVLHYYFLSYLLLIFFWPYTEFMEGARYILPILAFIILYFFLGLKKVLDFLLRRFSPIFFYSLVCLFFVFNLSGLIKIVKSANPGLENMPAPIKNFILLHKWIEKNILDKGIILSRKPPVTYFYTNHQAIIFPFSLHPEDIWLAIIKNDIRYIIVDEFSRETYFYLSPFLGQYKDKLRLLYRIGNTGIFAVVR